LKSSIIQAPRSAPAELPKTRCSELLHALPLAASLPGHVIAPPNAGAGPRQPASQSARLYRGRRLRPRVPPPKEEARPDLSQHGPKGQALAAGPHQPPDSPVFAGFGWAPSAGPRPCWVCACSGRFADFCSERNAESRGRQGTHDLDSTPTPQARLGFDPEPPKGAGPAPSAPPPQPRHSQCHEVQRIRQKSRTRIGDLQDQCRTDREPDQSSGFAHITISQPPPSGWCRTSSGSGRENPGLEPRLEQ